VLERILRWMGFTEVAVNWQMDDRIEMFASKVEGLLPQRNARPR
jgi:hypothetical protein